MKEKRRVGSFYLILIGILFVGILVATEVNGDETVVTNGVVGTLRVPDVPATPFPYSMLNLPPHFMAPPIANTDNEPVDNQVTDAGALLGWVLFYDTRLSGNDTTSCASCHQAANGFSDPDQFSTGFEGGLTGRNSIGLANGRYYARGSFFWDERAATLEEQVLMPIQDSVEMGMTLSALETKLAAEPYYEPLFSDAFGTADVTSDRISKALSQFVRSMVSSQSKYDQGVATGFSNFTPQENLGRDLFNDPARGNCAACHDTDIFAVAEPKNIGLDIVYTDNGVGDQTGNSADDGKFKSSSLRNIGLTAPYMHDGRFATLMDVVNFYNNQVQDHPNLDIALRAPPPPGPPPPPGAPLPPPRQLNLNGTERAALVAFLETLTDNQYVTDPKFATDPFVTGCDYPEATAVTLIDNGVDVLLSWADPVANEGYTVYRSLDPYFSVGAVTEQAILADGTIGYTDSGILSGDERYYYRVESLSCNDAVRALASETAVFRYTVVAGQ